MTRIQILDLYFLEARGKLIDLAAFLDRVERGDGDPDFRLAAFERAIAELTAPGRDRAARVLFGLSDLSSDPIPAATTKAACGAPPVPAAASGLH